MIEFQSYGKNRFLHMRCLQKHLLDPDTLSARHPLTLKTNKQKQEKNNNEQTKSSPASPSLLDTD